MHTLRTAILEHTTAGGVHHDWLIEDPTLQNPCAADARLWTARVLPPPQHWALLRRFDLTVIPPHRRFYLDYQGPVSGNRGHVRRLMSGTCFVSLWSQQRIVMDLKHGSIRHPLELRAHSNDHWLALVSR